MATAPPKCYCGSNNDSGHCCGPAIREHFERTTSTAFGFSPPVTLRGYMMVLAGTATERAQELHPDEPRSHVSICSILDADAKPAMSMVKIVRGGQASFLYPQVRHETGEASLEALLLDVTNRLCGKRGERSVTKGGFEVEMRPQKERALRLQRLGVIS